MSTELNVRLWFEETRKSSEIMADLVHAISQSSIAKGPWDSLIVHAGPQDSTALCPKGSDVLVLMQEARNAGDQHEKLSSGVACDLWRFSKQDAHRTSLRLGIETWRQDYSLKPTRQLDGDAQIWFPTAGPFVSLIDEPDESPTNKKVEENIEGLVDILQSIIKHCDPSKILLHSSAGMHHILNAHAIWLSSSDQFLADLAFLSVLWNEGNRAWKLPPLNSENTAHDSEYLHSWREQSERRELWEELGALIECQPQVTVEIVDQVLAQQQFDFIRYKRGFLLFEYPWMMNSFIDRFILAVLRQAGHGPVQPGKVESGNSDNDTKLKTVGR